MSYKEQIKLITKDLLKAEENLLESLKKEIELFYSKAVDEARKSGRSIESITYEILEGIEEGLGKSKTKNEQVLKELSDTMIKSIQKNITDKIHKSIKEFKRASLKFENSVESEKEKLMESLNTIQAYAQDKSYQILKSNILTKKQVILSWLKEFNDKIKEFIKEGC